MSEKHPGPLVVEGKLTDAERMKLESNYLRGTIAEDLNDGLTGGFKGDNFLLIRFHGMYQQDDRDIRAERAEQKLEPRHAMLLRCRLPGGVITTKQWQAIDKFAGENTIYVCILTVTQIQVINERESFIVATPHTIGTGDVCSQASVTII